MFKPPESKRSVYILGIESSCDDTSVAVCRDGKVISNIVANQKVHELYGGVVPELASRAHQQNIVVATHEALNQAGIGRGDISAIGFTRGPGLLGSLIVGTCFAKSLSLALEIPLIEVNHLQAHVLSHFIEEPFPTFPFLCLLVSGGHTLIIQVEDYFTMTVIGRTTDDAAGEAFDKTAKLLGLPYPGGILIDRHARDGNPNAFAFPEPRIPGLDYSFSGLKTAFMNFVTKAERESPGFVAGNLPDICASVQFRIVSFLMSKLTRASELTGIKEIAVAGGVSANSGLRQALSQAAVELGWNTYVPSMQYCTDNGGMIAITAYLKYLKGEYSSLELEPSARMPI